MDEPDYEKQAKKNAAEKEFYRELDEIEKTLGGKWSIELGAKRREAVEKYWAKLKEIGVCLST